MRLKFVLFYFVLKVNCLNLIIEHIADEFSKMKDEVPPALIESHVKMVESAEADGKSVSPEFGIEQSGIAGTVPDKEG